MMSVSVRSMTGAIMPFEAAEDLEVGDPVHIGTDGKAYPCEFGESGRLGFSYDEVGKCGTARVLICPWSPEDEESDPVVDGFGPP